MDEQEKQIIRETEQPQEKKVETHPVPYESVNTCKFCGKLLNGSVICINCGK